MVLEGSVHGKAEPAWQADTEEESWLLQPRQAGSRERRRSRGQGCASESGQLTTSCDTGAFLIACEL